MCGIAGIIDPSQGAEESRKIVGLMLETIVHRGPDGHGMVDLGTAGVLGHRRLAIIDV